MKLDRFPRSRLPFPIDFLIYRRIYTCSREPSSRGWSSRQPAFRYFVSRSNEYDRESSAIRWSTSLITRRILISASLFPWRVRVCAPRVLLSCQVGYQFAEIPGNHLRDRAAKYSSLNWRSFDWRFRDDAVVDGTPSVRTYNTLSFSTIFTDFVKIASAR